MKFEQFRVWLKNFGRVGEIWIWKFRIVWWHWSALELQYYDKKKEIFKIIGIKYLGHYRKNSLYRSTSLKDIWLNLISIFYKDNI